MSEQQGHRPTARARLTAVSWRAHVDLTHEEWAAQGGRLGAASRSTNWWLGDWVRFGKSRYGEKYELAAQITGYDIQTLSNMVYVASRFDFSRRRENVAWSIHAEIAPLEPAEQDHWLERVVATPLSVRALRAQLREHGRGSRTARSPHAQDSATPRLTSATETRQCPNCGAAITFPSAELADHQSTIGKRL